MSRITRVSKHNGEFKVFAYATITLFGRPFQTVQLTLSYPSFHQLDSLFRKRPVDDCGPATPGSPCGSPGLGSSEFARHYYRNHGCFLLLGVLRWFTSPGLLRHPMYSDGGNECSHSLGFPIRKSPDHSLLAASRSLSQLITSFIAYLRLGIHTHALSSLTIKSTSHTNTFFYGFRPASSPRFDPVSLRRPSAACRRYFLRAYILVFIMPVNIQLSKISIASAISLNEFGFVLTHCRCLPLLVGVVGPDGIEPSTSPLSGVRSSHLSYGPSGQTLPSQHWWSWSGSNRRPPECKSGALPAELQPLFLRQTARSRAAAFEI